MTTTKSFDKLNRLTQIRSVDGQAAAVASFDYLYNPASQRTSVTNADGSYWVYQYDTLGQVTSGRKYWADGAPVLGQQFDYSFDDIGNRKTAVTGGDQWGVNKRYQNYSANLLNQYTQRTVPGYADVVGTANSNATVTVNKQATLRRGEYYRGELRAENWTGPVWLGVTNVAVLPDGQNSDIVTNTTGHLVVPQTPEVFAHDADGNLTRDGVWTNFWDGENRLIAHETLAAVYGAGAPRQRLEYDYDPQGRRWVKRAYEWVSGAWSLKYAVRFVWDGWNLMAEVNPTNHLGIRSYGLGLDVSGSAQGAGGVGGLLWVSEHGTAQPSVHFAAFDGNGNVAALVDAVAGTVSANYEYGPFGETIRQTGPLSRANPFRFSTKYQEEETGCLYYGFRSYNPATGRWLSRDPIEESGGLNLQVFVQNHAITSCDARGLTENDPPSIIIIGPNSGTTVQYDPADADWQWHNPISWNNTTRNFKNHPLVKRACIDLRTQQRLIALGGHSGPHAPSYHDECTRRLNARWFEVGADCSSEVARRAVNEVVDSIADDVNAGRLKLYGNKDVFPIPARVANQRPDSYGFVKRATSASKTINQTAGKALIVLNVLEHVKAMIFFIAHPRIIYDSQNDVFIDLDDYSVYDSDGHFIGYRQPPIT